MLGATTTRIPGARRRTPPEEPADRGPVPARRRRPGAAGSAAVLAGTAAVTAHAIAYGRWIVDDAAITFVYARNIADGHGPVFQPGADPVEGYSNPAWTALLVVGKWLGLFDQGAWFGIPDYVLFPKLLAVVCVAAMLACVQVGAAAFTRRPWVVTLIAGGVLAAVPSFVIWTFSGLENPLYALAAVALAAVLLRGVVSGTLLSTRTAVAAGLLAALAALTRPDGLVYVVALPLLALLLLRRDRLRASLVATGVQFAAFAVPYGAYVLWRRAEFGRWVPNTAVAKAQERPGLIDLAKAGELVTYAGWLTAALLLVAVGHCLARPGGLPARLAALLVPFLLSVAAFAVLEEDWMGQHRFATPVWALGAFVLAVCLVELFATAGRRARLVTAVTCGAVVLTGGALVRENASAFRENPTVPLCLVAESRGRLYNSYAEVAGVPGSTYLGADMGGFGMTTSLRVSDIAGLVDARIADLRGAKDWQGLRDYVLGELRPTFINVSPTWESGLVGDPRLERDYHRFLVEGRAGAYIRKDAVTPERLAALTAYAEQATGPVDRRVRRSPRASCGDVLHTGQTSAGR